jgi:hypothetical protein
VVTSQTNGSTSTVTILDSNNDGQPTAQSKVKMQTIIIYNSNSNNPSAKDANGISYGNGIQWVNPRD